MIAREDIDLAKQRLTIPAIWSILNLPGRPGSPCKSPLRKDRQASFSVFDGGQRWKDHATGEGGDVVSFFAKARGIEIAKALSEFVELANGRIDCGPVAPVTRAERYKRETLKLNGLKPCSLRQLKRISSMRSIPIEGLRVASERGVMFICDYPRQGPCWVITDDARRNANARRLDGQRFQLVDGGEGPKAKCFKGSEASWPIGIAQASGFPAIALTEGSPDLLSSFYLAYAGGVEHLVAPVCMTGAACSIHREALPLFRGKLVRIFGHADEAGQTAMQRWADQLRTVEAEVDGFDFHGLFKPDGSPVKDLNELLAASTAASGCAIETITAVMDFALERRHQ